MILELEQFHKNYRALKKMYVIRKNSLYDAERTTLSSVVKRLLEDNPQLDPQVVEDILQSVLAGRSHITMAQSENVAVRLPSDATTSTRLSTTTLSPAVTKPIPRKRPVIR